MVWVKETFKGYLVQGPWVEQGSPCSDQVAQNPPVLLRITHSLCSHLCQRTRTPLTQTTVSQIPLPAQDCSKELRGQFCLVLSFLKNNNVFGVIFIP